MSIPCAVDVLIVGAGPAGLITAIGLEQQGISSLVVEKRNREEQATYGRATTLFPRSLELLEQVDVADDLIQNGFAARSSLNYFNGKRANERGWNLMFQHFKNSFHQYALNIRQRHSEDIFACRYSQYGKSIFYGWSLVDYSIDQSVGDGYNVTAILENSSLDKKEIRSKYIVGADGGNSTVRRLAEISQDTDSTPYEWIRMDGKMSTDMPGADIGFAAVESAQHGNILWVKLDRDAHRIGYVLTPKLLAKYPNGITEEEALTEAIEAMKPFELSVDRLDWWTHYKIKQSVAQELQKDEFILLAGDAAHTHSSAFAQGMNTAIHDATNLIWKLAGTCKQWYHPSVLETYHQERHAAAKRLIEIDRNASAIISGEIPEFYAGRNLTPDELLAVVFGENIGFNDGLDISYARSLLNYSPAETTCKAGARAPDTIIHKPGTQLPMRLYEALLGDGARGRWGIVLFAGNTVLTSARYHSARESLLKLTASRPEMFHLVTIIAGSHGSAWTALSGPAIGKYYLDLDGGAHAQYGVDQSLGAIAVIRPDHILGYAAGFDEAAHVTEYFHRFTIQ